METSRDFPAQAPRRLKAHAGGLLAVVLAAGVGSSYIFLAVPEAPIRTLLLFVAVVLTGLVLIRRLARRLGDPRLSRLQYAYLLKFFALAVLLRAGWMPMLSPNSPSFGYDAQRYYFGALKLNDGGFDPTVARGLNLNSTGIVYYYALVLRIGGENPVSPVLVNTLVTLLATLVLVRIGYQIKSSRGKNDWLLGLGMLLPEVVWFDVITSRETLAMSLLTVAALTAGGVLIGAPGEENVRSRTVLALAALLLLGFIRASMLLPAVAAIGLQMLVLSPRKRRVRVIMGIAAIAGLTLVLGSFLGSFLGSRSSGLLTSARLVLSGNKAQMETISWGERSVGQLLVANSIPGALITAIPRLALYLVAPLPAFHLEWAGLVHGDWQAWQTAMHAGSAVLNVLFLPLALAAFASALTDKSRRNSLALHIPCWCALFAIAGGNQLIQERYRVMASLLLWGCMWLGRDLPRRVLAGFYGAWFGVLALGGVFYLAYKVGL